MNCFAKTGKYNPILLYNDLKIFSIIVLLRQLSESPNLPKQLIKEPLSANHKNMVTLSIKAALTRFNKKCEKTILLVTMQNIRSTSLIEAENILPELYLSCGIRMGCGII